jgi:hypothetical protein
MSRWHNFDHPDLPERAFSPRGWKSGMTFEGGIGGGGGGGSVPTADPSIAEAQRNESAVLSDLWGKFKSDIYPKMTARADTQTANADTLAEGFNNVGQTAIDRGNEAYGTYKSTALPALQALQSDANNYNEAGYQEQLARGASADINTAFDQQRKATTMRQQAYGVDPTSGVAAGNNQAMSVQQALAGAQASNQVRQAAHELGISKQANLYNAGSGLINVANAQTTLGAGLEAQGFNSQQAALGNYGAISSALTGAGGATASGYGQVGNLGLGSYQAQISAYNAQQQANATSSAGWGGAIGSGLGAWAAFSKLGAGGAGGAAGGGGAASLIEMA